MATLGSATAGVTARSTVISPELFGGEKLECIEFVKLKLELLNRVANLTGDGRHKETPFILG
jgi:hypothetical protein